jgi:hypothetical protein
MERAMRRTVAAAVAIAGASGSVAAAETTAQAPNGIETLAAGAGSTPG